MDNNLPISVLIVGAPGMLRDSLCSLSNCLESVNVVSITSASDFLDAKNINHAELIVIDCNGDSLNYFVSVLKFKSQNPTSKVVVIVEHLNQIDLARRYGADEVLLRGFTGQDFKIVVNKILENRQAFTAMDR